jgi:hypothetical protein
MRVDTTVGGNESTSWRADFIGGNLEEIVSTAGTATTSRVNSFAGGITDDVTKILISSNGLDFTGGVIQAIAYYDTFTTMA